MTKDEALKLALEALEFFRDTAICSADTDTAQETITAIKEALTQPEQEPVAWRNAALRVGEDLCSVGPFGYYDMTAEQWLDWALSVVTVHAPPPHRKPLTDEEIDKLPWEPHESNPMTFAEGLRYFARAIEAAHGIKE